MRTKQRTDQVRFLKNGFVKTMLKVLAGMMLPGVWVMADDSPVDFNRDIRPFLSDRCFPCHGPDSVANHSGLRGDSGWPRNEVDRFVLARLLLEKMQPSPEAERWRWLRRVTFDLTGLPPTAGEITAFENDTAKNAFEKVVDRLLASPRYGERMAIPWLDAARYADSFGYQSDLLSPTWPWRDWVVRALNDNLPHDHKFDPVSQRDWYNLSSFFNTISLWLKIPEGLNEAVILHRQSGTDVGMYGTELVIREGRLLFASIRFWPGNALAIGSTDPLPAGDWVHVAICNDGSPGLGPAR